MEWKAEWDRQKAAGMHVKDLPKKLTQPYKPQLISGEPSGELGTSQGRDLLSESSSSDNERY